MVLLCKANKQSVIKEDIFENRFMHVAELNRMGAKISTNGNKAKVSYLNFYQNFYCFRLIFSLVFNFVLIF